MKERTIINILYAMVAVLLATQVLVLTLYRNIQMRTHTPHQFLLGERIAQGAVAFTVHKVRTDDEGVAPFTPLPGDRFVITELTIENIGTTTIDVIPLFNVHIKDALGYVYSVVAVPSEKDMLSGPLIAGDTLREEVGFEVRKDAQMLKLYYEPGDKKSGIIIVGLEQQSS